MKRISWLACIMLLSSMLIMGSVMPTGDDDEHIDIIDGGYKVICSSTKNISI